MNKFQYRKDGTLPLNKTDIFVFGSNLSGIHGAGAAKVALQFGAKSGNGNGLVGNSYAIPTKDENIKTLHKSRVVVYITMFNIFTQNNPNLNFFVTRVGCGLAGFKDEEIAFLFKDAINCNFAEEWKQFLE